MFILLWKEDGKRTWIKGKKVEDLIEYKKKNNIDDLEHETEIYELK
jgi:hypothetical protein